MTRQSPGRCIVQLGSVALTVTWLNGTAGEVADGELLCIVWRGQVAPRGEHQFERVSQAAPVAATVVWEQVLLAAATGAADWTWQPKAADTGGWTSAELAAQCVERLRDAFQNAAA